MKKVEFNAGPKQSYWYDDEHTNIHLSVTVRMSEQIDAKRLENSWNLIKRKYPVIDWVPNGDGDDILFFSEEGANNPVRSSVTVKPACDIVGKRAFSLTYSDKLFTVSAYRSVADEKGLLIIITDLLTIYGQNGAIDSVYQKPEECFVQWTVLEVKDYTPVPIKLYRNVRDLFMDSSTCLPENGLFSESVLSVDRKALEDLSDRLGTDRQIVISAILAEAIRNMNPDSVKELGFSIAVDFRKFFDIENSIAPCFNRLLMTVTKEHQKKPIEKLISDLAEETKYLGDSDYVKTYISILNKHYLLNQKYVSARIFDVGEIDSDFGNVHVKNMNFYDASTNSLFILSVGDKTEIMFQFGEAGERYMNAFAKVLSEAGISSEVVFANLSLPNEVETVKNR